MNAVNPTMRIAKMNVQKIASIIDVFHSGADTTAAIATASKVAVSAPSNTARMMLNVFIAFICLVVFYS